MFKDELFKLYDKKNYINIYNKTPDLFKEALYCKLFDIDYYFRKYQNLKINDKLPQGLRYKMFDME